MPTKRKKTSAPACKLKRSNAGSTCKKIVSRRAEKACLYILGLFAIGTAVFMAGSDYIIPIISAYGATLCVFAYRGWG